MQFNNLPKSTHFGLTILDRLTAIRTRVQLANDRELAELAQALIDQGFDREPVILEKTGDLGGIMPRARMAIILYRHGEDGVGEHLWNRTPESRFELVEALDG